MLLFILINTVEIAIENPLNDPNTKFTQSLKIIDYSMTSIFTLEVIIKIISNGLFFNGKRSYLKSYMNFLDSGVVIVTVSLEFILIINHRSSHTLLQVI